MDPTLIGGGRAPSAPRSDRRAVGRLVSSTAAVDDIVKTLWEAGVPVAKVMQPHRQTELDQLTFRGFFEDRRPPGERHGPSSAPCAMRLSGGPDPFHTQPAPLLGQHNHEVLAELGLTAAEIAELEADGVIGQAPAARNDVASRRKSSRTLGVSGVLRLLGGASGASPRRPARRTCGQCARTCAGPRRGRPRAAGRTAGWPESRRP